MDDFASFQGTGKGTQGNEDFMKEAHRIAMKYNGRNENELISAIYARAAEGKRNGTLTNEEIDNFYRQISPMVDGAKRKRLNKLIEKLKSM